MQWAVAAIGLLGLGWSSAQQPTGPDMALPLPADSAALGPAELDQLTAPVALYTDPLLGQVLTAATYPLEVVEAARWLDDPANAALAGDELAAALQQQNWDLSVKSLVPFPGVLQMMNDNLQWTERLGDAFIAQQADVMDSVQRLRQRAVAAGALNSSPQQIVTSEGPDIAIEPANPAVVYVPYYIPADVYGPWAWPEYPPYYFGMPPNIVLGAGLIGFGIGFNILGPYWGWDRWDWRRHGLDIAPYRSPLPMRPWRHDPEHRHGVPYRDAATAARYQGDNADSWRASRGYPPAAQAPTAPTGRRGEPARPGSAPLGAPAQPTPGRALPVPRQPTQSVPTPAAAGQRQPVQPAPVPPTAEQRRPMQHGPVQRPSAQQAAPAFRARPAPPAFESFGRGSQVRNEEARGAASRAAPARAPRAAPARTPRAAPAPRASPAPRGAPGVPGGERRP